MILRDPPFEHRPGVFPGYDNIVRNLRFLDFNRKVFDEHFFEISAHTHGSISRQELLKMRVTDYKNFIAKLNKKIQEDNEAREAAWKK